MSADYKYTQVGFVIIIMILLVGAYTAFVFDSAIKSAASQSATTMKLAGLVTGCVFVVVLASFYSFTIQISDKKLSFWFGVGMVRKSIPLQEICSVEVVKNPWYYFGGIKSIPGGWLYSIVIGGRAVELVLADGKLIRLGTNRPEEIRQSLAALLEKAA